MAQEKNTMTLNECCLFIYLVKETAYICCHDIKEICLEYFFRARDLIICFYIFTIVMSHAVP